MALLTLALAIGRRRSNIVCFAIFLVAARFSVAAQNYFTDTEADGIKAFLQQNFGNTKVRLELINPERKETNTVEVTRQKFLTSNQ